MRLCEIVNAVTTVGAHTDSQTYLADVSIRDNTALSKLDLVSGRTFVWGFKVYVIQLAYFLAPDASPQGMYGAAFGHTTDLTINGHVFADCRQVGWQLSTDRSRVNGGFMLQETRSYIWYKQDPPAIS
jgi:hypothetical protein